MIQFQKQDLFYGALKQKVQAYFDENRLEHTANNAMRVKMIFLYLGLLASYTAIFIFNESFLLTLLIAFIYGFFTFLLAFNVVHDAGHYALFKSKKVNDFFILTLDLLGISSFIWKTTHNKHHHSPNVLHHDSLVDDFKLGKITPKGKWNYLFKFQVYYIPILSLFYSLSLFLVSDFFRINRLSNEASLSRKRKQLEIIKLCVSKSIAIFLTIFLPYWYLDLTFIQFIWFFLAIHFAPGLMVGFFVAPSHFNTHLDFPEPDENNALNYSWSEHQLRTTEDFGVNNLFLNFSLGGFNHHVAHHLFPTICHIHYPKITPIIKQTAIEFQLPYQASSFLHLYTSHLKHLKRLGKEENIVSV